MLDNKESVFEFDNKKSFSKFVKLFSFKTVLKDSFVSETILKDGKEMTFTAKFADKERISISFSWTILRKEEESFIKIEEKTENKEDNIGWKIHVSIDDTVKNNIGKLWNLIIPIAIKHELKLIKLVMAEDKEQKEDYNRGNKRP